MRVATEGSLPPVMPQGNLVEILGLEVRQGSPAELMVESSPSRQRRPPCKANKEMSDEAADAAALTYLLTRGHTSTMMCVWGMGSLRGIFNLLPLSRGNMQCLHTRYPIREQQSTARSRRFGREGLVWSGSSGPAVLAGRLERLSTSLRCAHVQVPLTD